jgi:hypothetical protein
VGAVLGTIRRHRQFAEFETSPDRPGKRELLSGEPIELPPAEQKHNQIADRIYLRLRAILSEAGNRSLGEVHENARNSVESSGPRVTHSTTNTVDLGGTDHRFRGLSSLTKGRLVDRRQKTSVCPTWSLFK